MYTALVLDADSRKFLREGLQGLPDGWDIKCHHMTVNMGPAASGPAAALLGHEFNIEAVALGTDRRVMAVSVETNCPSVNSTKHITVAVNVAGGGKPKHSNEIKDWKPLDKKISLKGVVQEVQ